MNLSQSETEFAIRRIERERLDALLIQHGLIHDRPLIAAIEAYACANARAAIAIVHQVQADKE